MVGAFVHAGFQYDHYKVPRDYFPLNLSMGVTDTQKKPDTTLPTFHKGAGQIRLPQFLLWQQKIG